MKILITGGCGFVGSSIALHLRSAYPSYSIIAFDNLHRRGSELNIGRLKSEKIDFVHGDIRQKEDIEAIGKVDVLIEASAEPSVLAGIGSSPDYAINTNLMGTIHALNYARLHQATFIFLSTSRVYPINQIEKLRIATDEHRFNLTDAQDIEGVSAKGISERFPLEGYRSIYGATKLASELMIQEYNHFYGLTSVINRCGVLTGPWQMGKSDQGVAVLWLARHFWNQSLSYIGFEGSGRQVRDILHVRDLCRLIDMQIHDSKKFNGQTFNVGGGVKNSISLKEMTLICQKVTGNTIPVHPVPEARQADIAVYITDNSRIETFCPWRPEIQPEQIFSEIYEWITKNEELLTPILK